MAQDQAINQANPLGKIPALILPGGEAIFDSRTICDYLCRTFGGDHLLPPAGEARWLCLSNQALGDGIMDAAVAIRFETALRPADKIWPEWHDAQADKIQRALDRANVLAADDRLRMDIGGIAIACALGYLDFRFATQFPWRRDCLSLANWVRTCRSISGFARCFDYSNPS